MGISQVERIPNLEDSKLSELEFVEISGCGICGDFWLMSFFPVRNFSRLLTVAPERGGAVVDVLGGYDL